MRRCNYWYIPMLLLTVSVTAVTVTAQQADTDLLTTQDLPTGAWEANALPAFGPEVGADAVYIDGMAEIKWQPKPLEFVVGKTVRYIDFVGGDDTNSGTQTAPWKHHPWDPHATGTAAAFGGVATYVFKRGVVYRGRLVAGQSGTAQEPIRLTIDPAWGTGAATVAGSHAITGGWSRLSDLQAGDVGFPEQSHGKLWYIDLEGDFVPQAIWVLQPSGQRERLPLARWPNWQIEHPYNRFTGWHRAKKVDKGFPRTNIYAPMC